MKFPIKELLHVAAVVKASEWVPDGLQAKRFTKVEIGNRESDVFGDGDRELAAANKCVGVRFWIGNGGQ